MISVIMPVFNVDKYINEAIESILNQTLKDFEFIIIDDASTDKTVEKVKPFLKDERIKLIKLGKNNGAAKARNMGLDIAKGEFIVLMDGDDISLPNRFEMLRNGFISDEIGFVHSDIVLINEKGIPYASRASYNPPKDRLRRIFLKDGSPFCAGSMMIRKSSLGDLRYDENLRIGEDTDLIYELSERCSGFHVPEPLYLYRRHTTNTTYKPTYDEYIKHVFKFLNTHYYEELVPETDSILIQKGLVSLFIMRRGFPEIAQHILTEAATHIKTADEELFVGGIGCLAIKDFQNAKNMLSQIENKNEITYNFLGESCAYLGEIEDANLYFMDALKINPKYIEPRENLRALGGKEFTVADITWRKFLS